MPHELPKAYEPTQHEDNIYQKWEEGGFFDPDNLELAKDAPSYTIVMPPPNVTGTLHLGHAAMLALEDIMIRTKRMQGHRALWLPGTDHAAIATQTKVEKLIKTDAWRGEPFVLMLWGSFYASSAKALEEIKRHRAKHPLRIAGLYTWKHEGGKDKLQADLERLGYDWPQAYLHKPGQSPWKGAWGTSETPLFFLIDAEGRIVSLSYRFKNIVQALRALDGKAEKANPEKKRRRKRNG